MHNASCMHKASWPSHQSQAQGARPDLFLLAQSVIDRLARAVGTMGEDWNEVLQPTAGAIGWRLGVPQHGVDTFSEEVRLLRVASQ